LNFLRQVFEKSSFYDRPEEAEFRVDRRTDMTKQIVTFRSFANAHEKWRWEYLKYVLSVELQFSFDLYLGNSALSIILGYVYIVMFFLRPPFVPDNA